MRRGWGRTLGPCPAPGRSSSWGPGQPDWPPPWPRPARGRTSSCVEGAASVGGTTAMSGGVVWMPGHGRSRGPDDGSPTTTARGGVRLRAAAAGGETSTSISSRPFVVRHRRVADADRAAHADQWEVLEHWPDYRGELPGARTGGRSLWPRHAPPGARESSAASRPPSTSRLPARRAPTRLMRPRPPTTGWSCAATCGAGPSWAVCRPALVDAGVEIRTGTRATELVHRGRGGRGGRRRRASRTGPRGAGIGRVPARRRPGGRAACRDRPSPPWGRRGAAATGCAWPCAVDARRSATTSEAWWMPALHVPGEEVDGVTALPPAARRAGPAGGDHGRPRRPALRRRGAELRRRGPGHARRARLGRAVRRAVLVGLRRRLPRPVPGRPARARRRPTRPGWCAPTTSATLADDASAWTRPPSSTRWRASTPARRRAEDPDFGRGSFPYDRWIGDTERPPPHVGTAVRGPLLRPGGPSRLHGDQGWAPHRRPGPGAVVERGRRGRALRGGQRRGQPLRHGHGGGRSHARARPRVRLPRRRGRGGTGDRDGPAGQRRSVASAPPRGAPHAGTARPRHPARCPAVPAGRRATPRLGTSSVPRARYTSRAVHEREVDTVWRRVWQMACREEQIPDRRATPSSTTRRGCR